MPLFRDLPLRYKIVAIALTGALGFMAYLAYSLLAQQRIEHSLQQMQNVTFPLTEMIDRSGLLLFKVRNELANAIADLDDDRVDEAREYHQQLTDTLQQMRALVPHKPDQAEQLNRS